MRARLILGGVLAACAQLAATGLLLTSAWLIVRAAQQPPVLYLMVAIVGVRFFGVGRAAARYAERLVTHDVALDAAVHTRVEVYRAVARLTPHGLDGRRHGDVVQQAIDDVDIAQDRLLRIRLPWWSAIVVATVVFAVVAILVPWAGLVVGVQALATFVLLRVFVPQLSGDALPSPLAADVTESARASAELVALGVAPQVIQRATSEIDRTARHDRRRAHAGGVGSAIVLIATAGALIALAFIVVAAVSSGDLAPVLAGVVMLAPLALADAADPIAEAERRRPAVEAAERRLANLIDAPSPVPAVLAPIELPSDISIQLEDVAVGWDGPSQTQPVSVTIDPGQIVGISGRSGVGKSTLALTLVKLVRPRSGRVLIGGVDSERISAEDLRGAIGVLGQDEAIFDTTVRENLRLARPDADDGGLRESMRRAGLDLDLDRTVGEGGSLLSGGERQRLALARLLLGRHRVLVLDEPTEHLDAPLARSLMDDVIALAPEHTIILISHDPAVLERCERVVHMERPDEAASAVA